MRLEKTNMVTWKVVLVVIAIAILFMAIGMWLGYRYISEQDDIRYEAQNDQSDMYTYPTKILLRRCSTVLNITHIVI